MAAHSIAQSARTSNPQHPYTFTAPEGVAFDDPRLSRFTTVVQELGMSPDAAQLLVDMAAQVELARAAAHHRASVECWNARRATDAARAAAWGELHEQDDEVEARWHEARLLAAMH